MKILYLVVYGVAIFGCNVKSRNQINKDSLPDIYIYHMLASSSDTGYGDVEAILFKSDTCYYLPLDSNTLSFGDFIPSNKVILDSTGIKNIYEILQTIKLDSLSKSGYSRGCGLSKNEFLIRFKLANSVENYYFHEIDNSNTECQEVSILDRIKKAFDKIKADYFSPEFHRKKLYPK